MRTKAKEAKRHMPFHFVRGDERGLDEEQRHPESHDGAMDVDELVGKWGFDHSGEEVGLGEAEEDGGPEQNDHGGEEDAVGGAGDAGVRRGLLAQGIGCHGNLLS
jgi:hypothetical protein